MSQLKVESNLSIIFLTVLMIGILVTGFFEFRKLNSKINHLYSIMDSRKKSLPQSGNETDLSTLYDPKTQESPKVNGPPGNVQISKEQIINRIKNNHQMDEEPPIISKIINQEGGKNRGIEENKYEEGPASLPGEEEEGVENDEEEYDIKDEPEGGDRIERDYRGNHDYHHFSSFIMSSREMANPKTNSIEEITDTESSNSDGSSNDESHQSIHSEEEDVDGIEDIKENDNPEIEIENKDDFKIEIQKKEESNSDEEEEEIILKNLDEDEDFQKEKIIVDESFSVNQLKQLCKNMNLSISGNKSTLISRIMDNQK